jgi:hypothetical protein
LEGVIPWAKFSSREAPPASSTSNEVLLRVYEHALVFRTAATVRAPSLLSQGRLALLSPYTDPGGGGVGSHPHEKPAAALEPLIELLTNKGDVVLDPFSGSGAILCAARARGCAAVGLELRGDWAQAAHERLERLERHAAN